MIHDDMQKICLVSRCLQCQGTGTLQRKNANHALNSSGYYDGNTPRVPCAECTNGFIFKGIEELDLLVVLIKALRGEFPTSGGVPQTSKKVEARKLREELFDLFMKATEEKMVGSPG